MAFLPTRIWALNHIIAPHGITDIVHAHVYKQYPMLAVIYGGSAASGWLLHSSHHDIYLYSLFGILSVVHFRHDFNLPKWMLSLMLFALLLQPSPLDGIYVYMLCFHVPNHYRMAWHYVKQQQMATIFLLWVSAAWCDSFLISTMVREPYTITSIIIAHILYEEFVNTKLTFHVNKKESLREDNITFWNGETGGSYEK
jgi:hypothetical protein